jgi:hypothetical protein
VTTERRQERSIGAPFASRGTCWENSHAQSSARQGTATAVTFVRAQRPRTFEQDEGGGVALEVFLWPVRVGRRRRNPTPARTFVRY